MTGDNIKINDLHLKKAEEVLEEIQKKSATFLNEKFTIGFAGESGSGKSVSAFALKKVLEKNGIGVIVLQMDDYFNLPPETNHNNRIKNLENVGIQEVNLSHLNANLKDFKSGIKTIRKPLVHFQENSITTEEINTEKVKIIIVEGTYILELDSLDYKIFIDRNYKHTKENRLLRNREEQTDFIAKVLEIEHQIIKKYKNKADLILDISYQLTAN